MRHTVMEKLQGKLRGWSEGEGWGVLSHLWVVVTFLVAS